MEDDGRKAETSQSPNHANNGSNEFQAPKMQTIHFWDDLYFSSPVKRVTPCTTPSIVKDESTVQNRDRAVRSEMVTDTPEVLGTHLIKEDADIKVPQNKWREGIFSLPWKLLPVKRLTAFSTPFIVKDESTVQNRDRADRSEKVTDTPEVLDTHLTKEDVDSKVPQNKRREGIYNLRWIHSSVILLTPFPTLFIVKDESTDQNRDRADRREKVTDTPKVLGTHLTKEDVDIKVPQNKWREWIFSLPWKRLPVKRLTPFSTPFIVKDESTVQNRDRADRSDKVTDTPEVLDTNLTKEDVDNKVPQNNSRERIFNLRWKHLSVHQVIVVFLLMTPFTQGISSHCDTSRTMNCTQLFMTCSFDTDIIRLAKNIYMNHLQNNSVDLEIILSCQRSSKGFHCETSRTYEFVSVESNRLTVRIPEVNLEHVGKYWCNVHGFADIDQKVCQLSVRDTSSEDCFQQVNGPLDKDDRFSPAIIAIIVLGSLLVLVVTSIIFICFISSGSAKYIATCFNFENCKSGIYEPTTITEEECEKL